MVRDTGASCYQIGKRRVGSNPFILQGVVLQERDDHDLFEIIGGSGEDFFHILQFVIYFRKIIAIKLICIFYSVFAVPVHGLGFLFFDKNPPVSAGEVVRKELTGTVPLWIQVMGITVSNE